MQPVGGRNAGLIQDLGPSDSNATLALNAGLRILSGLPGSTSFGKRMGHVETR